MRILISAIVGLFCFLGVDARAQSADNFSFPRLGVIAIGNPHDYDDPARQATFAKYDVVILNIWPGWDGGRRMNMETVIKNIKSRNPNTKVFLYVVNNEKYLSAPDDAWYSFEQVINDNTWWLYQNGGGGTRVRSTYGETHYLLNNSIFSPRSSGGENFIDYFARFTVDSFLVPNPSADGFFLDNMFWKPRADGDWNRDGVTDDQNNPVVQSWTRQGLRNQIDAFRARAPGKLMIGNIADLGEATAVFPELDQVLDGGVMESMIGQPHSAESWGGWSTMMSWYRKMYNATSGPKLTLFAQDGSATDYRGFRYGYASCLLDNAVFHYNPTYGPPYAWFDEYDNKLGPALSGPSTAAWQSGVYRRDFERGIVLVNPKGNGAVTLSLEKEYRRISGTQDPAVNSGTTTRSVTLQDRDGIVLMRVTPAVRPTPPTGVRVE